MNVRRAIQDTLGPNHCLGCGRDNPSGLGIESFWQGPLETTCTFTPEAHMVAGPRTVVNGGVIATVVDCHAVCTAISHARRLEARGADAPAWYATGTLEIRYLRPARIDRPLQLHARIVDWKERKAVVECTVSSDGEPCAEATVVAVRVSSGWRGDERNAA